jgi:hypothetical protein
MDAREELKRWIATVVQMSAEEESKVIKQDIDLFLSVAGELSGKLADRNTALAKQIRPRSSAKPSKPSPQKAQKEPDPSPSSDDIPAPQTDAEGRSQERSGQLSQRQRSEPSPADQQRALRGYVYGAQNDEVQFQQSCEGNCAMNDKLIQSQQRLRESLYDLYEIGGLDLMEDGTTNERLTHCRPNSAVMDDFWRLWKADSDAGQQQLVVQQLSFPVAVHWRQRSE